jgi:3-oxoacyl-[acyl-carrier-protein] synthase-3
VLLTDLAERLALPRARVHRTHAEFGNMGSASLPVTLDQANRAGELTDGDLLLVGFGGGMAIGAGLLCWVAPRPVAPSGVTG